MCVPDVILEAFRLLKCNLLYDPKMADDTSVKGFADTHVHLMSHLGFGGVWIWGKPFVDESISAEEALAKALGNCTEIHKLPNPDVVLPLSTGHDTKDTGYPKFQGWPVFNGQTHQQAYIDWIERAYRGGLRLIVGLVTNNFLAGKRFTKFFQDSNVFPDSLNDGRQAYFTEEPIRSEDVEEKKALDGRFLPYDDWSAVFAQVNAMKAMVKHIRDSYTDSPLQGWMEIAYSPADARRIINEGKLAIVLGVEVDSFLGWNTEDELDVYCDKNPEKARKLIKERLSKFQKIGISHVFPVHYTNNAFGGGAVFRQTLNAVNWLLTGKHYVVEEAKKENGVSYRIDQDNFDGGFIAKNLAFDIGTSILKSSEEQKTLDNLSEAEAQWMNTGGGHINTQGLTRYGEILIEELINSGIIIDLDHMSLKMRSDVFEIAEKMNYPLVSGHTHFMELKHGFRTPGDKIIGQFQKGDHDSEEMFGTSNPAFLAAESALHPSEIERIRKLNGLISPMLQQGDPRNCCDTGILESTFKDFLKSKPKEVLAKPDGEKNAPTSRSFAQAYMYALAKMEGKNVAMSTDVNGFATFPAPRFSTRDDRVQYAGKEFNGGKVPEEKINAIWVAFAAVEFDIEPRFIEMNISESTLKIIEAVLIGFREPFRASINELVKQNPDTYNEDDRRCMIAAFLVKNSKLPRDDDNTMIKTWYQTIFSEWSIWNSVKIKSNIQVSSSQKPPIDWAMPASSTKRMSVPNPWLKKEGLTLMTRSRAGNREFDYNHDGLAHYGMIPDFIQDLLNIGVHPDDLEVLNDSAERYIQVWERCEKFKPE